MPLGTITTLFRQFRPLDAVRLTWAIVARRLLDPYAITSYAQTGEDRLIESLLPSPAGFYVDVGSNHPVRYSNTFALYRRGWRGIVVDGNEALIRRHRRTRPRDVGVHAVVSDVAAPAVFTEFENGLVSSLDPTHVEDWSTRQAVARRRTVTTQRLSDILAANDAPRRFDLLSVDVEGHDFQVLASLDFERFRPRLVVVEIHDLSLAALGAHRIVAYLTERGYDLVSYAKPNGYFLSR
jgi:FkbM family methyltransferase